MVRVRIDVRALLWPWVFGSRNSLNAGARPERARGAAGRRASSHAVFAARWPVPWSCSRIIYALLGGMAYAHLMAAIELSELCVLLMLLAARRWRAELEASGKRPRKEQIKR